MGELKGQRIISRADAPAIAIANQVNHAVGIISTLITRPDDINTMLVMHAEANNSRFAVGQLTGQDFVDGDVDVPNDLITIVDNSFDTGDGPFRLSTGGTLPAGLATATDYFTSIPKKAGEPGAGVEDDPDKFGLALSRADAFAGTLVDITAAAGGGTHTIDGLNRLTPLVPVNTTTGVGTGVVLAGEKIILPAAAHFTVRGFAAGTVLTYWWL